SDIAFNDPISEERVAEISGEYKFNPTPKQWENAGLALIVGGSQEFILMVEGEDNEVFVDEMIEAIQLDQEEIKRHCQVQVELTKAVGKEVKRAYSHEKEDLALYEKMRTELYDQCYAAVALQIANKSERSTRIKEIKEAFKESLGEDHGYETSLIGPYFSKIHKEAARNLTLNEKKRLDGRRTDEIRPIWSVVDYLPSAHGSAVFTRGETQSVTTCTLGTKMDEQMIDGAVHSGYNKF